MENCITQLEITMSYGGIEELIHPILIQDESNCILVDCGFVGSLPLIETEIKRHGLKTEEITGIILTHHDHDHMGAAAAFKRKYPTIKIYASEQEAPYISGTEKPLRLIQAEEMQKILPPEQQEFGRAFCGLLRSVEPVEVDVPLQNGDYFDWGGGCKIIATPGHTPGHISLYLPELKTIIAGDAIALKDREPVIANPHFTLDSDSAASSISKLLNMDVSQIICYHGGEYRPDSTKKQF